MSTKLSASPGKATRCGRQIASCRTAWPSVRGWMTSGLAALPSVASDAGYCTAPSDVPSAHADTAGGAAYA